MEEPRWRDLGSVETFAPEELHGARVAGYRLCVGRTSESFFAIDDTCPHAGGSLSEGMIDGELVICPLHAFGFEVKSGHCAEDPACSVRAYEVRVEDGRVQVLVPPPRTEKTR